MGARIERLKQIAKNVGQQFSKIGATGSAVMKNMEKADKEMNEKMKNITKSTSF
jgi:hypothetical protein